MRAAVRSAMESADQGVGLRMSRILKAIGVARSSWYARPVDNPRRAGARPKPVPQHLREAVVRCAVRYPWWGYKRIAVVCRRDGVEVTDRPVYKVMREARLLQLKRTRKAAFYQAARLFELLPVSCNRLWQCDVTYIHVPGSGWWYAVTVIDNYSRYLLACHFTPCQSAVDLTMAISVAKQEAERLCGRWDHRTLLVTDNGPAFVSKRFHQDTRDDFRHVRIAYRTPTQLGLLERFHQTLKTEEVYWRLYRGPSHARDCLAEFHMRYNMVRPHWALRPIGGGDPVTPVDVYVHGVAIELPRWQGWARAAQQKLLEMTDGCHYPVTMETEGLTV